MAFRESLLQSWQTPNALTVLLFPLSLVYRSVFFIRKLLYRFGLINSYKAPVPVIVVGNLTVGGTGKTPLVIHLVELLRSQGFTPGVISRGYSGHAKSYPLKVTETTAVHESGDEPALIVRRTNVGMVVGPDRQKNIELLLEGSSIDVIISDDGLQHLRLKRDIEVCLIDGTSPLKNTQLLPAGPYRESLSRLSSVDLIVEHVNDTNDSALVFNNAFSMQLTPSAPKKIYNSRTQADALDSKNLVHAVAGIGNPQRFFNTCKKAGFNISEHAFADHHQFQETDFSFDDQKPILMTEKDAVKCTQFDTLDLWFLPVDAVLGNGFSDALSKKLHRLGDHP